MKRKLPLLVLPIVGYPLKRWTTRKRLWLDLTDVRTQVPYVNGLCINRKYCISDIGNSVAARDLRRLVKDGLAVRVRIGNATYLRRKY